jgi:hypothetical protein
MRDDGDRYRNKRSTESPSASAKTRSLSTRIICDLSHTSKSRQLPSYSSVFIFSLRHTAKRRQACYNEQMFLMVFYCLLRSTDGNSEFRRRGLFPLRMRWMGADVHSAVCGQLPGQKVITATRRIVE